MALEGRVGLNRRTPPRTHAATDTTPPIRRDNGREKVITDPGRVKVATSNAGRGGKGRKWVFPRDFFDALVYT